MCGLVGLAGDIAFKEEKVFKDLLMLDVIRGKHSTGVASLHKVGQAWETSIFKEKLNAVDFMDRQEFISLMGKKHSILLGHNRWATRGAIIKENAHPFEFEHIVGAHNGSLNSTTGLHEQTKYAVDSQAAFSELNENGVATLWGKLNGAAALSWIDKRDNTINFLRNDERPLWIATINKGKTLVWASEFWMLHVACGRNGIDLDKQPMELVIDTHYKFSLPSSEDKKDKVSCKRTKVDPYVAPKWTAGSYGYSSRYYDDYNYVSPEGRKFLEMEGINERDYVYWTVNPTNGIVDTKMGGKAYVNVRGKTLKGTPIGIFSIPEDKFADLILEMWEGGDTVFRSEVSYAGQTGLILSVYKTEVCEYTLGDLDALTKVDVNQLPN